MTYQEKLLAIAALALSNGNDIAGMTELDFAAKFGLEDEYFSGKMVEIFWMYYKPFESISSDQLPK